MLRSKKEEPKSRVYVSSEYTENYYTDRKMTTTEVEFRNEMRDLADRLVAHGASIVYHITFP